jgi:L,D-transpeptidase catalytic domain
MQPIAGAVRPLGVVTGRGRSRGRLTVAGLVTAIAVIALAGFYAESRGSALPAATHRAGWSDRTPMLAPAPSRPATTRHSSQRSPCVHNRRAQLIVVSIKHQHLWACAHHRTVLSSPVTTGATSRLGDATPRGTFAVQGRTRDTVLTTSAAGRYRVKYWIPFHLGVWGFHDASWQTMPFGSTHYVTRGSHGCVHMPLAAIRRLFHWVHYGTRVRIR